MTTELPKNKQASSLYQNEMLKHHKNPIGFNKSINANNVESGENAVCGDEITLQLAIEQSTLGLHIRDIAFNGDSCAICRASASILCQQVHDVLVEEAQAKILMVSEIINSKVEDDSITNNGFQAFAPLSVVQQYPVRKQCALLPWLTLQQALENIGQDLQFKSNNLPLEGIK